MDYHIREGFKYLFGRYPNNKDLPYLTPQIAYEARFRQIMKEANLVYKNASDRELVKRILYVKVWELSDDINHPFSALVMNASENIYGEESIYSRKLSVYIDKKILKYTGITFPEYLEMSRCRQLELLEVCKKLCDIENKALASSNAEHDALMKEMKDLNIGDVK